MNMSLWPRRQPTYRIVEVKNDLYTFAVQQRVHWLWFEFWWKVDGHFSRRAADVSLLWFEQKERDQRPNSIVTATTAPVVKITASTGSRRSAKLKSPPVV